jgi:hypothetical protein
MGDTTFHLAPVVCAFGVFVSGCTQVVVSDGAQVRDYWLPGLAIVNIDSNAQRGAVTSIEGAGLIVGGASLTMGWHREQVVSLPSPSSCQIVFIVESHDELVRAQETLQRSGLEGLESCAFSTSEVTQ